MRRPQAGEIYQHFKGMLYQVMGIAIHSETREELVIYQALYGDYKIFARPLVMFVSAVDREKYPDASVEYRFTKVERDADGKLCPPLKVEQKRPEEQEKQPVVEAQEVVEIQPVVKAQEVVKTQPVVETYEAVETQKTVEKQEVKETQQTEETKNVNQVNPDLMAFLDARDYGEKLEILYAIRGKIDDQMMTNMELSMDLPVAEGTIEERIATVKHALQTMARFETRRLR